jgi:hypothetical protein
MNSMKYRTMRHADERCSAGWKACATTSAEVGTPRCGVTPAFSGRTERAARSTISVAPLNAARTAQRAVPTSLRSRPTFTFVAFVLLGSLALNSIAATTETNNPITVALTHALHEPDLDKRLEQIADVGAKLALAEIPDALKAADSLKELREQMVLKQSALSRWSELSPEDAFAWIARLPESQLKANALREAAARFAAKNPERAAAAATGMNAGVSRNDTITLVANAWANADASSALAWAEKLPAGAAKESALDAIRYVWVRTDPIAASTHIEKLPQSRTKNNLIAGVAHAWAARDHTAAIDWAERLADVSDSETALVNIAESWANRDPQAAAAFALKLPTSESRSQAGAMVASRWARQNPRLAADWTWSTGDAEIRNRGLSEVFEIWAGADPDECGRWLEKLPSGPDRDQAIQAFITTAVMWAPDVASRIALLIENDSTRRDALDQSVPRWMEVDENAAMRWLSAAKIPDGIKARWRKTESTQ